MNISILTTEVRSEHDLMLTRQRARQIADLLGFDLQDQTRIATGVSEIARNAVQHAGGGRIEFQLASGTPQMLHILIKDKGPGISDVDAMLRPQEVCPSERGHSLRGVRQLMDMFYIATAPTQGTQVTLGKRRFRLLPAIEQEDMAAITQELMQRVSEDPLGEMQRQNQELLHMLEDLRVQQEERTAHLVEIEILNRRLRRSMQASHHRVKNNLQIISALVEVQTNGEEAMVPVSAMIRIGQHARALASIHDLLTQEMHASPETEVIFTKAALDKLIPLMQNTTGGRRIVYHVEDFALSVQASASLALLISELISNAIKHGHNEIELNLTVQDQMARLEVCNDGEGFPPDFDWQKAANVGLSIIDSAGRFDLKGTISYENRPEGGARVIVTFPINEKQHQE